MIKDLDSKTDETPKVEYIASSLTIVSVTKNLKIWLLLSHFVNIIYFYLPSHSSEVMWDTFVWKLLKKLKIWKYFAK